MKLLELEETLVDIELSAMDIDTRETIDDSEYYKYIVVEIIGADNDVITVLCEEL